MKQQPVVTRLRDTLEQAAAYAAAIADNAQADSMALPVEVLREARNQTVAILRSLLTATEQ